MKKTAVLMVLAVVAAPAWAATKTATLSVPGMTCAACPVTVRAALSRVAGVEGTRIEFKKREAIVTYDDSRTDVRALTKATRNAGYPSVPVSN
ncbi:MAG: mercury resistance system periplasmic binding protein MerP [Xanthomonadaceae bacterium]|nr:mercury resistance system periplasmic binding protein MerP [Xanthomonadaceae bacterium]